MSAKSKKLSEKEFLERPFAPAILAKARKLASQYQITLSQEDGEWYGRGLECPNVFGDGKTPAKCIEDTREALVGMVATMLEMGQRPPAPARTGRRTTQINIRLTAEEKALLEAVAQRKGFSGVSDYVRASVLEGSAR